MATFGQIIKGTRARKRVTLPLAGASCDPATLEWKGAVVELDLRALSPLERAEVTAAARAFAVEKGVADPNADEALYVQGLMLHTLAVACIDAESPEDAPRPFFDGGFEQLYKTEALSTDHIAYLYELQEMWEDEVSPRVNTVKAADLIATTLKAASGDAYFFVRLRPSTRWSCFRTMAARLLDSLTRSSGPGSSSEAASPTTAES